MERLAGKVAIVTDASRGIGKAIALKLAQDGAKVVVNYTHSKDKAHEVVATIEANGGKAIALQADMSHLMDIRRFFQQVMNEFKCFDILVNNAGVSLIKSLAETTEEEYDRLFALNTKGAFFILQEAAREIPNNGRIVNISISLKMAVWFRFFKTFKQNKEDIMAIQFPFVRELYDAFQTNEFARYDAVVDENILLNSTMGRDIRGCEALKNWAS